MKLLPHNETVTLKKIVGGGQALGELEDGRKCFVWGGLPGETVEIRITKKKSHMVEGIVERVIEPSKERVVPTDPESYLSTSPWQIMTFAAEQKYKAQLIDEAFTLHHVTLPTPTRVFTDNVELRYRNKVEFSWYGDTLEDGTETLDLAFFRRGTKGKIVVDGTSLARSEINVLALQIRNLLRTKEVSGRELKTLLIRSNQKGNCVWQLYVKSNLKKLITLEEASSFQAQGGEIIYSDPRSPASRITKRLAKFGDIILRDTILGTEFRYATEGFFQVNIPVYEQALKDMAAYIENGKWKMENGQIAPSTSQAPTLDLYSGVGTIGLTIGSPDTTLVEINEDAVREMRDNITQLSSSARAVLAPTERALEYIVGNETVIVDPPRAGLHTDVIDRLLETKPPRIVYLSCNSVTQARDVSLLLEKYSIISQQGYNFFPRTPHIEHLVVLDAK